MSDPLTKEELETLKRLEAEATAPPWRARWFEGTGRKSHVAPTLTMAEWEFCCVARNLLPRLLAQLEAQGKALLECRETLLAQQRSHEIVLGTIGDMSTLGAYVSDGYKMSCRRNDEMLRKISEVLDG